MDQNEMSTLYREPSIDASYQVSYHLVKRFQRKTDIHDITEILLKVALNTITLTLTLSLLLKNISLYIVEIM
jgi:hypothetical protein